MTIGLIGHTDSKGGEDCLSCIVFKRYCCQPNRINDREESSPIASNDTAEGRKQNRGTEFVRKGGFTECKQVVCAANQN